MDYHIFKSMVNGCFSPLIGGDKRPVFFDVRRRFPQLDAITRAYPAIRAEFDRLLERNPHLPAYHEIDKGEAEISATTAQRWNVCMLEVLGHRHDANRAHFPETCRVLNRVPNLLQAFFSILEPRKAVPLHAGPYFGYLRYHLGLRVPTDRPPSLVINGRPYFWKEGEAVLFDDSWPHEVVNHSDQMRVVLIVDIARPLPYVPSLLNKATLQFARHTYGTAVARQARQFVRRAA